jgi:hypothetical protein
MTPALELFGDMEETPTPREKWMRDNDVRAFPTVGIETKRFGPYKAVSGKHSAYGVTQNEAIVRLAFKLWSLENIKIWTTK